MKKIMQFVLVLCLILPVAFNHLNGMVGTTMMRGKGIPIEVKEKSVHSSSDRGSSIHASIDGHCLTISFSESIGQVAVEVTSVSGVVLRNEATHTPEGLLYYIPLAGDYIVTFTLANGDEYYGEFTVTD